MISHRNQTHEDLFMVTGTQSFETTKNMMKKSMRGCLAMMSLLAFALFSFPHSSVDASDTKPNIVMIAIDLRWNRYPAKTPFMSTAAGLRITASL